MMRDGALQTEDRGLEQLSAPDVVSVYRQSLQKRGFVSDAAQWRAVERLHEMQSAEYLQTERRSEHG